MVLLSFWSKGGFLGGARGGGPFAAASHGGGYCGAVHGLLSRRVGAGLGDGGFAPEGRLGLGTLSPDPADFGHGRNLSLRRVIEREGKTYGFPSHILSLFAFLWAYQ